MFQELAEVLRKMFEKRLVVELTLHLAHRVLVLDLPPRQLAVDHLDEDVEQRPQVVVSSHLLILVRVDRRVANGSAKAWNSNTGI